MRDPDFIPATEAVIDATEKVTLTAKESDRARRAIYLHTVERQLKEYERLCALPKDDPEVKRVLKDITQRYRLKGADTAEFLRVVVNITREAIGVKDYEVLGRLRAATRRP